MGMRLLVLGGGGREHALVWKLAQSPTVDDLFCAPGNPGTATLATNVPLNAADPVEVRVWAEENAIDLVVVGPEDPLAAGVGDELRRAGLLCLGPDKGAARIESSKVWAKNLLADNGIPTGAFEVFDNSNEAIIHLAQIEYPAVVKADGLALGKGVVVAREFAEAEAAVEGIMTDRVFGAAGNTILVEECLFGQELSAFAITDGTNYLMLPFARDFKRVGDGDIGPNTGGMGCYSPVALQDDALRQEIEEVVIQPTLKALAASRNPYVGFLYAGLMITSDGPQVIEFNCRLGDPETQAIMPLLEGDLADAALLAAQGRLTEARLDIAAGSATCVVLASGGYPGGYDKGFPISGIADVGEDALVFQAGTAMNDGQLVTNGGRVLAVVGLSEDVSGSRAAAYANLEKVAFDGAQHRGDIAEHNPESLEG